MKTVKSIIKNTLFSFVIFLLFTSCIVGLGPAIDLMAPEVTLDSHSNNDSVPESFVLYGTATDNDAVSKITISFEDAEMYYQIVPGESTWQKKNQKTGDWKAIQNDSNNYCNQVNGTWNWSVVIDTDDKTSAKTDSTFTFTIIVYDKLGNSTKKSKVDCSVVLDTSNPSVSIYKPELFEGTYESIVASTSGYETKDGNVISRLLNGDITFSGRISNSVSFKGMKIEFDNGKLKSGINKTTGLSAVTSIEDILNLGTESSLGDTSAPTVYYSKLIEKSDLKEWTLTVSPEEWATSESGIANGLNEGKHIIRVITTALSSSGSWERKVIGYFLWYPEADVPWLTVSVGDVSFTDSESVRTECYPGSNISGIAQDDDEIQSFVTRVYKLSGSNTFTLYSATDYQNPVTHTISVDSPKYAAWTMKVPTETGVYKLEMELKDKTGNSVIEERYFKSSDVGAPSITIVSPANDSSAITNAEGNISFNVSALDNTQLESFAFVWLNPKNSSNPNNRIKYLTGTDVNWKNASPDGWKDEADNKIYEIAINDDGRTARLSKDYNLFTDFGINGDDVLLSTQEFIFRASDGINVCVATLTLSGDSITPQVSFNDITIGTEDPKSLSTIPSFDKSATGKKAKITGTWKDDYTASLKNLNKIKHFTLKWGKQEYRVNTLANDKWEVEIPAVPAGGGTLTAEIQDFGGNSKTVQAAVNIETADLSLSRIGCNNDDGAYNAGKEIEITLNFSKNTDVNLVSDSQLPYLVLNNGGTATYIKETVKENGMGSGSTIHRYKYVVASTDSDIDKLGVSKIVTNGATWCDSKVQSEFTFFDETGKLTVGDSGKLENTRTIKIDNKAPVVESIQLLSSGSSGDYYKENDNIMFLLTFSENVTVKNLANLKLKFNHNKTTDNEPKLSGATGIIFTHKIESDENNSALEIEGYDKTDVEVKDSAGNNISLWNVPSNVNSALQSVKIDTTKPSAPKFMNIDDDTEWNPSNIILESTGTSFKLVTQDKDVAAMEYSIDNGTTWTTYSDDEIVTIKNNGTYTVISKATDNAGNVSDTSTPITFTIDAGELLTKLTATTSSGSYNTEKKIEGRIEFRKEVTISQGASVTLNISNGDVTSRNCVLEECKSGSASSSIFTFVYTIVEGDSVEVLDITKMSLGTVKITDSLKEITISVPEESSSKRFKNNRTIKIDAIAPKISGKPTISGTKLTIPFDSVISKGSGSILITYDTTVEKNEFHVPAVLTASEYSELEAIFEAQNPAVILSDYYEQGTNGAKVSGNTLVSDTSTKYTLKINKTGSGVESISDTDSNLVNAFITANKHKVTVPVIVDEVSLSTDKKTMTVDLSSTYAVPVKGAVYSVSIPAGLVNDEVNNQNVAYSNNVTAPGVEKPEIRIYKPDYTLYNKEGNDKAEISSSNWVSTESAYVDMSEVQYATMFLNCRTPGATIKYTVQNYNSTAVKIKNSRPVDSSRITVTVDVPTSATEVYESTSVSIGSPITGYNTANGIKYAIAAQGTKEGFTSSELSYEYATRSVVKLLITGNYRGGEDAYNKVPFEDVEENEKKLTLHGYKPWLMGGDSPSGENSIETFPLSWSKTGKYQFMAGKYTSTTDMLGQWYWVSWNVPSSAYIGFMVGDVPADAVKNGPSHWVPADYHWVPMKEYYPLYPGEELIMAMESDSVCPMGANLGFGIKKKGNR